MKPRPRPPSRGRYEVAPAASTPRNCFNTLDRLAAHCSNGGGPIVVGSGKRRVHGPALWGSKPGATLCSENVRMSRPAPTSSIRSREPSRRLPAHCAPYFGAAPSRAGGCLLQCGVDVHARGVERWNQSKQNAGDERQQQREAEDRPIEGDRRPILADARDVPGFIASRARTPRVPSTARPAMPPPWLTTVRFP